MPLSRNFFRANFCVFGWRQKLYGYAVEAPVGWTDLLPASDASERPNHHFTAPLRVEEIMDDSSGVEVKSRTAQVALSFSPNTVVALDRFSVDGILLTEYEP